MIKAIDSKIAKLKPNVVVAMFVAAVEDTAAVEFALAAFSEFISGVRGGWVGAD